MWQRSTVGVLPFDDEFGEDVALVGIEAHSSPHFPWGIKDSGAPRRDSGKNRTTPAGGI
jgi:hypothetical protein